MKTKRQPAFLFLLTLTFFAIIACNKKPENIGLDLVDDNQAVLGFDTTLSVYAYSELEDSVASAGTSINLLGSMQTETFGGLQASFYAHMRLSEVYPDFGDEPVADSMVLTMVYSGYYGNINTMQTFTVHRIIEDTLLRDSAYTSNVFINYEAEEIGSLTFTPNPTDTVFLDTIATAAELRIPMDLELAQELLDADSTNYESSAIFLEFFRGLYVKPAPVAGIGEGAILYFDLLNERSSVTLYYQNNSEDSLSYEFVINESSARVGKYEHDYSLTNDPAFIDDVLSPNPDTATIGKDKLFLQGLGGVKTIVKFPQLQSWADSVALVINEAKLVITSTSYQDEYAPPDNLILFKLNENGGIAFTEDQSEFTDDYYGGNFNSSSNSYTFRISLYMQNLLLGGPDYGLVLFPGGKSVRANGLTFYGTDQSNPNHLKLKLIYTLAE